MISSAMLLAAGGCGGVARDLADRDVARVLKEFSEPTLGYQPQVEAKTSVDPRVSKKSYRALPLTELPDPRGVPLSPVGDSLPVAALGPVLRSETVQSGVPVHVAAARAFVDERLTYGPPATVISLPLDLFDALKYGVRHSRDYQTRMESLYSDALDVTLQRYLFTPRPFVTGSALFEGAQGDGAYNAALTAVATAGVRQRLPLGGEIVASGLVNFVNAINGDVAEGEDASIALTGTIPLLRGAGLIAQEDLILTERQLVYSLRSFEEFRRAFAVELATRYLRLIVLQRSIFNTYRSYQNAEDLLEKTVELFSNPGARQISAVEVQRTIQQFNDQEEAINRAIADYGDNLDTFKLFLGMPVEQPIAIVPIEVSIDAKDVEDPLVIETALRYRLDLQTARDRVEDARRNVSNAKNGLLPDLNLSLGGNLGNSDTNRATLDGDDLNYNARLDLSLPVDRLSERNIYRRALITLEQSARNVVQVSELVRADVRASLRQITRANVTLQLQRKNIENAQQRLVLTNELLLSGKNNDSRNVVEAQTTLLNAQTRYDNARADLQIQQLEFLRDSGLLRVDPDAGILGVAMDRAKPTTGPSRPPVAS